MRFIQTLVLSTVAIFSATASAEYCTTVIREYKGANYSYEYDTFTRTSYSTDAACSDAMFDCSRKLSEYQSRGYYYNAQCAVKSTSYPQDPGPSYPPSYPTYPSYPSYPSYPPSYPTYPPRDPYPSYPPRDPYPGRDPHYPGRDPGRYPPPRDPGRYPPGREPYPSYPPPGRDPGEDPGRYPGREPGRDPGRHPGRR